MTLADLKADFDKGVGAEYGIVLEFPPANERLGYQGFTEADYSHAKYQLEVIDRELSKYPVQMIQGSLLETIYLVGKATFGGRAGGKRLYLSSGANAYIFHHEMWHVLDSSYEPWIATSRDPVTWVNPPGFVYGQPWEGLSGFASRYAQKAENEDQADTAAYIWSQTDQIHQRIATDMYLRRKVKTIVQWYSSHDLKRFDHLLHRRRGA